MNTGELLGAVVQSGMSASSNDRMKNSLGGKLRGIFDCREYRLFLIR